MLRRGFIALSLLAGFLPAMRSDIQGRDSDIRWEEVIKAGKTYFEFPSQENARRLYLALPGIQIPLAQRNDSFAMASQYFDGHLTELSKHMAGDRTALRIALRLLNISDGGFSEELYDLIGDVADKNPKLFLEEMKDSTIDFAVVCCGARLSQLCPDPEKAEEYNAELDKRIRALESVSDPELITLRDNCIHRIRSCRIKDGPGWGREEAPIALLPAER